MTTPVRNADPAAAFGTTQREQVHRTPSHKEYNDDKEDDTFLDEVEESLLGESTRPGFMAINDGSSGSRTLFSASRGNSPQHSRSSSRAATPFQHHTTLKHQVDIPILDDPSSFRRKIRAAIFYLLCSTLHEAVIYKIAQRTTWPNATLCIPIELLISTIVGGILTIYMKKSSSLKLQHAIGVNGLQILPSKAWKESMPLAALIVAASVLRILKDALLEASISTATSVSQIQIINNLVIAFHSDYSDVMSH